MAQSFQETQNIIDSEKATRPQLDEINSPSNVSIWKLQKDVWASAASFISTLFDLRNKEAKDIVDSNNMPDTLQQIRRKVLEYQEGHTLVVKDFKAQYETVDESARVIKHCAVRENGTKEVIIMIAGENPLIPYVFDFSELNRYLLKILFAGIKPKIRVESSDRLHVKAYIIRNGSNVTNLGIEVMEALRRYCDTFTDLRYDGYVYLNDIRSAILKVEGVGDLILKEVYIRYAFVTDPMTAGELYKLDVTNSVNNGHYPTYSGTLTEEDLTGYTFNDSIGFYDSANDIPL